MEYVQMTLDDWLQIKDQLKMELIKTQEGFVRIGYLLRKIEDQKLYEQDGYDSLKEFARLEYGLDATTVSRFVNINRKYSIDGYSDRLRPEFIDLGSSKLSEMLSLPDGDLEMIRPEMSREGIRELKKFNKAEAEPETSEWDELLKRFYEDNMDVLSALYENKENSINELVEIINPSGNRIYRKGLFFLSMYEDCIKLKKYGPNQTPQTIQWQQFFDDTWRLFGNELPVKEKLSTETHEIQCLSEESVIKESENNRMETVLRKNAQEKEECVQLTTENVHIQDENVPNDSKTGNAEEEKQPLSKPKTVDKKADALKETLKEIAPAQSEEKTEEKMEIPAEEKEEIETITVFEKLHNMTLDSFAEWVADVGCPPGKNCGKNYSGQPCVECWELYLNQYEVKEEADVL